VDASDVDLRRRTYAFFVEAGRAPEPGELGGRREVEEGWRRLHDAHALVLDPESGGLRMLNPFSAAPTPYRVDAAGRSWYANCAWDAFGICAALHVDGRIDTTCLDCGEAIAVDVQDAAPSDDTLLFHCLVPAQHWWDDIVFT
jgi:hypothetical protein